MVRFPRTKIITKFTKIPINLCNGGIIPATVRFEIDIHKCFKCSDGMSATLQPKSILGFDIEFNVEDMQTYTHKTKMLTINNPHKLQVFSLAGEAPRKISCLRAG